ncbi:uncharacterized protein [Pseudorasbora parva]|uniref:uncharacterized protein isoform X1 n=1 Tax=Pseudorasbora parva TaxID=51549 RepID=UPI00351E50F7
MFSTFFLCQIILALICQTLCYEPTNEDFKCFNDYETEMKCSFMSDSLMNCTEYKLNITHPELDTFKKYTCFFEGSHHSANCECKCKVQGFVATEIFSTTLLKGTRVLFNKTFETRHFIKPKTPVLSVKKTENGNFYVTWDNKYETIGNIFAKSLEINLTYRIEGGHKNISKKVPNSQGFYDILGTHLQPNTNYILTATMSTSYNNHKILSDESAPVEFTTSSSLHELVKTVVPALCVGLIIIICTIFFFVLRMKMNWWDKISKPKIDQSNLGEEKGHILPPSILNFSPIHVEITKLDFEEEKKLNSVSSIDTNNEKSSHSVESAAGDYGQAGFDSGSDKENRSEINVSSRVNHALDEDFKSFFANNTASNKGTTMVVKSVDISSSRERNRANRDSGNCSGSSVFSNMSYMESATDDSSFLEQLSCDHSCQSNKKDVFSFEDFSMSADISKNQFNFPTSDAMEDGYRCFNSVVNQGNDPDADACLNLLNDVDADEKFIVKNLIASRNPLYPSLSVHDGSITPSDDGYQAFEGLTKSTEGQWSTSIKTEQALNECGALKFPHSTGQDPTPSEQPSLRTTSLHFSPFIQIDMSYQSV